MHSSHAPQRESLCSLDDAETVNHLSQDSCSTNASTPELLESFSCSPPSQPLPNAEEEQLRRRAQHGSISIPELKRNPEWHARGEGPSHATHHSASSANLEGHDGEELIVPVRCRLVPPSTPSAVHAATSPFTTPWVAFSIPRSAVVCVAHSTSAGANAHVPDPHTANTATTSNSGTESHAEGNGAQALQPVGSVQLSLSRTTLLDAVRSCGADEPHRDAAVDAALSVSRAHCTVHLHFSANRQTSALNVTHSAAPLKCHSLDVFALSPATYLSGVPLQPHYRYHFRVGTPPCSPNGVLTLQLGTHCYVDVATCGVAAADEGRSDHTTDSSLRTPSLAKLPGGLALHRHSSRGALQREVRDPAAAPINGTANTTTSTAHGYGLARASTTSLLAGDSTAVLATLSGLSDPVVLSEEEDAREDVAADVRDSVGPPGTSGPAVTTALGEEAVRLLPKRRPPTAPAAAPAQKTTRPPRRALPPPQQLEVSEDDAEPAPSPSPPPPAGIVLFTTGIRLSDSDEQALKALGAQVNPHLRFAKHARVLVAQKPLIRSVKLLTVLPYLHAVVQQSWLDTVLHTHTLDISPGGFLYRERRLPNSIESVNSFDLQETLAKPSSERQRLFAGHRFWVHRTTTPQDPPMNDLKTVLAASGGVVTRRAIDADVLVLPQHQPSTTCWRSLSQELGGAAGLAERKQAGALFVVPDDIFKCVLQQRPLLHSSVSLPRPSTTSSRPSSVKDGQQQPQQRGRTSSTRTSTRPSTRKTPRTSTSAASSPRSSTRRRS